MILARQSRNQKILLVLLLVLVLGITGQIEKEEDEEEENDKLRKKTSFRRIVVRIIPLASCPLYTYESLRERPVG